ncbi:hypothetical protein COBT_001505 [Conglomerata obtusa]
MVKIEANTNLTSFIRLFEPQKEEETIQRRLKSYKLLMRERRTFGHPTYINTLKFLYINILGIKQTAFEFVVACGSDSIKHKSIAYSGAMLCEEDIFILMIHTLKKDLCGYKRRLLALNYICNMANRSVVFKELSHVLCLNDTIDSYLPKILVAYYVIHPLDQKINLVQRKSEYLFVKLQIILDYWNQCNDNYASYTLCENEIKYLQNMFFTSKSVYVRTKILQVLLKLKENKQFFLETSFLAQIENKITKSNISNKTDLELCLSFEVCNFLFANHFKSQIADNFVFRLLKSKKEYQVISVLRLVRKYDIHVDFAIERLFELGIHKKEIYQIATRMINKENVPTFYSQKNKHFLILKSKKISKKIRHICWDKFACKLLSFSSSENSYRIIIENPTIATRACLLDYLTKEQCNKMLKEIIKSKNIHNYPLIYQIIKRSEFEQKDFIENFDIHFKHVIKCYIKKCSKKIEKLLVDMISVAIDNEHVLTPFSFLLQQVHQLKVNCNDLLLQNKLNHYIELISIISKYNSVDAFDTKYIFYIENNRSVNEMKKIISVYIQTNDHIKIINAIDYCILEERKSNGYINFLVGIVDNEKSSIKLELLCENQMEFINIKIK